MCMYLYRFGSFEIFKPRDRVTGRVGPSVGRGDILEQLLDYVIKTFYPEVRSTCTLYTVYIYICTCMYTLITYTYMYMYMYVYIYYM